MLRTSPNSVLFSTYNLYRLAGGPHYEQIAEVIRSLDTDVLAVQELLGADEAEAAALLRRLADDTGLRCDVAGHAAVGFGGHGCHVGLLWRDGVDAVPGSLRCYGGRDFWHALVMVTLDVGGTLVRHAAHHATPFGRALRAAQNELLVGLVSRSSELPVLIGADWNTECADRAEDGLLYEPADPYAGIDWFDDMVHQCGWDYDAEGRRRHWADRHPGDMLWSGGLHDAAALTEAPWQPTAGHHPADVYGAHGVRRRIDAVRVTGQLSGALLAHHVRDTPLAVAASDHLPVTAEYVASGILG